VSDGTKHEHAVAGWVGTLSGVGAVVAAAVVVSLAGFLLAVVVRLTTG
jgi:hypothetical protein